MKKIIEVGKDAKLPANAIFLGKHDTHYDAVFYFLVDEDFVLAS